MRFSPSRAFRIAPTEPAIVAVPSADPDHQSPSQRARLQRLRQPANAIPTATQLADRIDEACDDVDRVQLTAITARDEEAMAWLVLCDRGWPREVGVEDIDLTAAYAWLSAWGELTSLPVTITTPQDRTKLRWIETQLDAAEAPLQEAMPAGLWQVVGALDATGRATLSYVLNALAALVDARAHCSAAASRRDELFARFAVHRTQSRKFGVRAPLAPLDVRSWRAAAGALRAIRE
jgi:hypothetical protein